MKLREVKIKNFRCLVDVIIPLDDTTVLVGENNTGKTAFLDALKIVLTRSSSRGLIFDEYDYHMCKLGDSPQTCEGVSIELWFREDSPDEWPDTLIQALTDIVQTDPTKDLDSIGLRVSSKYDSMANQMVSKWEFLTIDGQPLGGRGANPANVSKFLTYIRLFYLSALRISENEFSPKSQFWGKILRDLKISDEQRKNISDELSKLNEELLNADPRLTEVKDTLANVQKIMSVEVGNKIDIQALPLKAWELMSKAEVVMTGRGGTVDFPLSKHGQGMQSLAVLFLFQAYIDVLLKPNFQPETNAILALEEPESHLHPHAIRALASNLSALKSQKIISSHSPYFIQEIPLSHIRMFSRDNASSKVLYIKRDFSASIPADAELIKFCSNHESKFNYSGGSSVLTVKGKIEEKEYRDLLTIYKNQKEVHPILKKLYEESQLFLADEDLAALDTYAKRIRGEVFFARTWLLCEGQSEYLLLRYFAEVMGKPFDQYGITVVDFQNNGSPGAFVGLALTYQIPWILICDNDTATAKFQKQIKDRGISDSEMAILFRPLPEKDFELFLIKNGFTKEYLHLIEQRGISITKNEKDDGFSEEVASILRKDKVGYTIDLINSLRDEGMSLSRIPSFFQTAINDTISKAG